MANGSLICYSIEAVDRRRNFETSPGEADVVIAILPLMIGYIITLSKGSIKKENDKI